MILSEFCATSEAATIIGCTPANIRALERAGKLQAEKTAKGMRLFKRSEVEAYAKERAESKGRRAA